jgi:hypothetical protein
MKNLTYNNINCKFTFKNVSLHLTKFWINEIMRFNSLHNLFKPRKIWLTVIVANNNNRTFILIKNLPFNVSDYTDVIIVLKQVFENSILRDRIDILQSITFKFYIENKNRKIHDKIMKYYKVFLLILFNNTFLKILKVLFSMFIIYLCLAGLIFIFNQVYQEYINYVNEIKGSHLKWVLENRFSFSNNNNNNPNITFKRISRFLEFKTELIYEYKDFLSKYNNTNILNTILNELSINFKSEVVSINATPNLNKGSLTDFLFEARGLHPMAPSNPLGIQGINHNLDEISNMLDKYLLEHRSQSLERLNYHSNIMYILVNKLSPYLS